MTQAAVLAQISNQNQTFRNRVQNGAMVIDQRNNGASVNGADQVYTLDRWLMNHSGSTVRFTLQRNAGSVTPPPGFSNYLGITSSGAYTPGAAEVFGIQQRIEGFNMVDLAWGTSSASTVTLSFWVRSSLTGLFGGSIVNSTAARSYPFSYTISAANTWEFKTITIPGDTVTTPNQTNGVGMYLLLGIGAGASASGTAGAWASGNVSNVTGNVNVLGTSGATFYITGVQLEKGTVATPFELRPYSTELAMCQRYYETSNGACVYTRGDSVNISAGSVSYAVDKRAAPTIVLTNQTGSCSVASPSTVRGFGVSITGAGAGAFGYTSSAEL